MLVEIIFLEQQQIQLFNVDIEYSILGSFNLDTFISVERLPYSDENLSILNLSDNYKKNLTNF